MHSCLQEGGTQTKNIWEYQLNIFGLKLCVSGDLFGSEEFLNRYFFPNFGVVIFFYQMSTRKAMPIRKHLKIYLD